MSGPSGKPTVSDAARPAGEQIASTMTQEPPNRRPQPQIGSCDAVGH
jgi:hypothetical protein